jgi:hypothetical protein
MRYVLWAGISIVLCGVLIADTNSVDPSQLHISGAEPRATESPGSSGTPPVNDVPIVDALPPVKPEVPKRRIGNVLSSLFTAFVRNKKNFEIKPYSMRATGGRIKITSVSDVDDACFVVHPNGDATTRYMQITIKKAGAAYASTRNLIDMYKAIKACAKKHNGHIGELVICTHGFPGSTIVGLAGRDMMSASVASLINKVNRDGITIAKVRFISCSVGAGANTYPMHIMRQLAAGWNAKVMAWNQTVYVGPGSVSINPGASMIVVKPKEPSPALPDGSEPRVTSSTSFVSM